MSNHEKIEEKIKKMVRTVKYGDIDDTDEAWSIFFRNALEEAYQQGREDQLNDTRKA